MITPRIQIGCKVDGRILCKIDTTNEILDICQIETAKSTNDILKNITDRAKLAIDLNVSLMTLFLDRIFH